MRLNNGDVLLAWPLALQVYTYQPGEYAVQRPAAQAQSPAGRLQTITIGPVTQGDADAILAVCKERRLDELGLYRSAWTDENAG